MKVQTSVRVEKDFYDEARDILKNFGLTFGDAVNLFLAKITIEKGIPFDLKLPNEELKTRIKNIENKKNITKYKNSDELFDDLGI